MQKVVEYIINELVEDKKAVKFKTVENGNDVTIHVDVADSDKGRVIGKKGATVNAIRTILKNCGPKDGKKYFIQVGEKKEQQ